MLLCYSKFKWEIPNIFQWIAWTQKALVQFIERCKHCAHLNRKQIMIPVSGQLIFGIKYAAAYETIQDVIAKLQAKQWVLYFEVLAKDGHTEERKMGILNITFMNVWPWSLKKVVAKHRCRMCWHFKLIGLSHTFTWTVLETCKKKIKSWWSSASPGF